MTFINFDHRHHHPARTQLATQMKRRIDRCTTQMKRRIDRCMEPVCSQCKMLDADRYYVLYGPKQPAPPELPTFKRLRHEHGFPSCMASQIWCGECVQCHKCHTPYDPDRILDADADSAMFNQDNRIVCFDCTLFCAACDQKDPDLPPPVDSSVLRPYLMFRDRTVYLCQDCGVKCPECDEFVLPTKCLFCGHLF